MKPYKIPLPIYDCVLLFQVTPDVEKRVNELRRKHDFPPMKGPFYGIAEEFGNKEYWILIADYSLDYNTLCHEIFHTTHTITEDRAIKDEEAQAWLCGYISQKIFDYLKQHKMKIE